MNTVLLPKWKQISPQDLISTCEKLLDSSVFFKRPPITTTCVRIATILSSNQSSRHASTSFAMNGKCSLATFFQISHLVDLFLPSITSDIKKYQCCPVDQEGLTTSQLIEPAENEGYSASDEEEVLARQKKDGLTGMSAAKTNELINILNATEPGVKSLVFSQVRHFFRRFNYRWLITNEDALQWTSHLNCIEAALSAAGIVSCRFVFQSLPAALKDRAHDAITQIRWEHDSTKTSEHYFHVFDTSPGGHQKNETSQEGTERATYGHAYLSQGKLDF